MLLAGRERFLAVSIDIRAWRVQLAPNVLDTTPERFPDLFGQAWHDNRRAVVVDEGFGETGDHLARVTALYHRYGLEPQFMIAPAGEPNKTLSALQAIADQLIPLDLDRTFHTPLFHAWGGGVVTDLVTFFCAIYRRGARVLRFPTTLLGMVDAGIAAKSGINYGERKHTLGAYDPGDTVIDPTFVRTESARGISNGLCEMAKAFLPTSAYGWDVLRTNAEEFLSAKMQTPLAYRLIWLAVRIMLARLARNRRERRHKRSMNIGHTITPTFEMTTLDGWPHGFWVRADLALFLIVSHRRGHLSTRQVDDYLSVLRRLGGGPLWHDHLTSDAHLRASLLSTARYRGGQQLIPLVVGLRRRPPWLRGLKPRCRYAEISSSELFAARDELRDREMAGT